MYLDDSACNLASLNLMTFVKDDGEFDVEGYKHAVRIVFTAQEIIVDNASYPTERIGENSRDFRPIGLGYANLGALLMNRGLAYDSDGGRSYAAVLTSIMQSEAALQSARISRDQGGPFAGYKVNREPYLKVMNQHRDAAYRMDRNLIPTELLDAALTGWDEVVALGEKSGFRNGQLSVLAPTGTIAFMMDCDTTGVEPDIALIKYKRLVGGGYLKIVNQGVPNALRKLGYDAKQAEEIVAWIDEHETIEGAPHISDAHLEVFDCAFKPANGTRSIHYNGHLKMMAAVQPFISGAISKTVNMPELSTAEEIAKVYIDGWKLGLKAIAVYRDNSKRSQPLNMKREGGDAATTASATPEVQTVYKPLRRRLPDERASHHPQVQRGRPRGLPDHRHVRGRHARRDLPAHGEGGLDDQRAHGQLRDGHQPGAAVRRAAEGPGQQVQPSAVRAGRVHGQPGYSDGEVAGRLHLPVHGDEVHVAGR